MGEAFTREVMRRIRSQAAAPAPVPRLRRWLPALAAAAVLAVVGFSASRGWLPIVPGPAKSKEGFSVFHAYTNLAEPYRPGDPLSPGDVVVAERGGSIPVGGRLVRIGPGGIAWIPGAAEQPRPAPAGVPDPAHIIFAMASEDRVQVVSGGGPGIAWRVTPTDRRRYLYQLVDLAEGGDAQAAGLAREELTRVLGPAAGATDSENWRLALNETDERGWHGSPDDMVFPFQRSALALGGPSQDDNLATVSHAVLRTLGLVGDRWMPGPVDRLLRGLPREEGS